jgi:signal transduction histidine kinase
MSLLAQLKANLEIFRPVGSHLSIGANYSFSWWVVLIFAFPSYTSNLIYDPQRVGGTVEQWIPVALITYAVTLIAFIAAKFIKFAWLPTAGIVYSVSCYLVIGLIRGFAAFLMSIDLGLAPASDLIFRLVSPPLFTAISMSLCAAVVATISLQQEALDALAKERTMFRSAIKNFQSLHQRLQSEMIGRVRGLLNPAIDDLRNKLQAAAGEQGMAPALTALQQTVDDVVRPLSHQIASEDLSPVLDTTGPINVVRSGLLPDKVSINLMSGWGSLLSIGTVLVPLGAIRPPIDSVLLSILVGTTFFVTLKVLESVLEDRQYSPVAAFLVFICTYFASGFAAPMYWTQTQWHMHFQERINFALLSAIVGIALFIVGLANSYRQQTIAELQKVNDGMALLTSQLRQQVWLDHRRVAQVLHGSVQGALYAAAIRLGREANPSPKLIEEVQREIIDAMKEVSGPKAVDFEFEEVLDSIISIWEDAIDFEIRLDPAALRKLNANRDASECALEVIREAVNNSVKHGKAEKVAIEIEPTEKGLISLQVSNDGQKVADEQTKGYGSSLLDELTHTWRLINQSDSVVLTAMVVA